MQGRRREVVQLGDLPPDVQPGDYWQYVDEAGEPLAASKLQAKPSNLTGGVWGVSAPNGAGIGTLVHHTVREEDDGTCSIRHGDGSSNSVLISSPRGAQFHGYLEHGVWRSV